MSLDVARYLDVQPLDADESPGELVQARRDGCGRERGPLGVVWGNPLSSTPKETGVTGDDGCLLFRHDVLDFA